MQVSRLFEITYLLLEHGTLTARALSERFEVSVRTIYRDIDSLSAAGIPVYMSKGRNGGIRLLPDFVLDKTVLSQVEKEEILSALGSVTAAEQAAAGTGAAGSAMKKLGALFGSAASQWIEVDFSGWGWGSETRDKFECIKDAVLRRRVLAFTYYGGSGEMTTRLAEPLKLVFRGQAWYVYAWCRSRCDFRFFKLSRMEDITVSDETHDREVPERVTQESAPAVPETVDVTFRADRALAFRIYDAYRNEDVRKEPDGSLVVRAKIPRGEWLMSYFLSYGAGIEILEPEELRREMQRHLEDMLGKYQKI